MDTSGDETAALMICPTFTYKAGTLFSEEYVFVKNLNDLGVHVDIQCQLVYDPKTKAVTQLEERLWKLISFKNTCLWKQVYLRVTWPCPTQTLMIIRFLKTFEEWPKLDLLQGPIFFNPFYWPRMPVMVVLWSTLSGSWPLETMWRGHGSGNLQDLTKFAGTSVKPLKLPQRTG